MKEQLTFLKFLNISLDLMKAVKADETFLMEILFFSRFI